MSLSIDFISKECKNSNHFLCSHQWEGFGVVVNCNCECHRKLVFDKDVLKHDSNNENNVIVELNNKGEFNK